MAFVFSAIRAAFVALAWWFADIAIRHFDPSFPGINPILAASVAAFCSMPWTYCRAKRDWELYRDLYS